MRKEAKHLLTSRVRERCESYLQQSHGSHDTRQGHRDVQRTRSILAESVGNTGRRRSGRRGRRGGGRGSLGRRGRSARSGSGTGRCRGRRLHQGRAGRSRAGLGLGLGRSWRRGRGLGGRLRQTLDVEARRVVGQFGVVGGVDAEEELADTRGDVVRDFPGGAAGVVDAACRRAFSKRHDVANLWTARLTGNDNAVLRFGNLAPLQHDGDLAFSRGKPIERDRLANFDLVATLGRGEGILHRSHKGSEKAQEEDQEAHGNGRMRWATAQRATLDNGQE